VPAPELQAVAATTVIASATGNVRIGPTMTRCRPGMRPGRMTGVRTDGLLAS
jgi:hypothetical protein